MATLIQALRYVLDSKDPGLSNETRRVILKEALQAYALDYLYNHPTYRRLSFYGGTCLHVVYGLNRLSEDLDLDNSAGLDLAGLKDDLIGHFGKSVGYSDARATLQRSEAGILRVTLKFPILNALGLSSSPAEALHVKVEVSHHKQVAVLKQTPVLYHGRSFVPSHFSLETMMAGKLLACLERNFRRGREGGLIKGRDFYDLLWLMQKQVAPLVEKLAKDGKRPYTVAQVMTALKEKVGGIRDDDLRADLLPLFESPVFVDSWIEAFQSNFEEYSRGYV